MPRPLHVRRRLLLAEDDVIVAFALQEEFAVRGFELCDPVATCRGALERLQEEVPAVAVLDAMLADGPCVPVAHRLRQLGVPFLVFSGFERANAAPDFSGFDDVAWLCKPMRPAEVADRVALLIDPVRVSH